jgi:hypothetical protein
MGLSAILKEFGIKVDLLFDAKKSETAKKSVAALGSEMKHVAMEVAGASAALLGFAELAGRNSRSLQENSDLLGINVERLQELEYAAKVAANVSRGELVGALESVSNTLDRARHSDVMAGESLIRLGIPIEMITNRSVTADQVMMSLADSFKGLQDPIAKARLAADVFGGAGARLLPLLNKGSKGIAAMGQEARALGVILGKGVVNQGAEFDRQFSKVWIVLKNISYLIGNELIKYLKPMVMEFQKWTVANRKFIATGIVLVMKSIGTYLGIVFKTVRFVIDKFQALTSVLGGTAKVANYLAIAFGVLTAVKLISGLGTLVTSFRAISAVLGLVSIQSVAIGAGLLALILVVQDLFSKDSIIKQWFATFKKEFPALAGLTEDFVDVMSSGADLIAEGWANVWSYIQPIKEWLASGDISSVFKKIESAVAYLRSGDLGVKLADFVGGVKDSVSSSLSPSPAAALAGGGGKSEYNANVTVQVPPGTSAQQAIDIAGGGVSQGFDTVLRQTKSAVTGGVAY